MRHSDSRASRSDYNLRLVEKFQQGDRGAGEELLQLNRPLILVQVRRFLPATSILDADDLIQEGALGLMHAAELFAEGRGASFSTYAVTAIRRSIARAIDRASRFERHLGAPASIDAPIGDDDATLSDLLADESDAASFVTDRVTVSQLLAAADLKPIERQVIIKRFGLDGTGGATLAEVGAAVGCSRQTILVNQKGAIAKLRAVAGCDGHGYG